MIDSNNRDPAGFEATLTWLAAVRDHRAAVVAKARLLMLDTLACIVAGLAERDVAALAATLARDHSGVVSWPGSEAQLSPSAAAFVGATAACWHEACEGLANAHGRPGLHAIPTAMALGVARGLTIGEVTDSIVWGYEIGGRAGQIMRIGPGLHVDGTWGVFAAVAAAARLMNLSHDRTLTALAIAACQISASLYAPVAAGNTARNTYSGRAAVDAFLICAAAEAGVTAPASAFDLARRRLAGEAVTPATPTPSGQYLILDAYIKPFAAVRHVHYAAACALQRFAKMGGATTDIQRLTVTTYPEALTYCGNRAPATPIQALFSLSYGLAFALRCGGLGPEAYQTQVFADAEQIRLEALVTCIADPSMTNRGAILHVVTRAGPERYSVETIAGDPTMPMSESAVIAKAMNYMMPVIGRDRANQIADRTLSGKLTDRFDVTAISSSAPPVKSTS